MNKSTAVLVGSAAAVAGLAYLSRVASATKRDTFPAETLAAQDATTSNAVIDLLRTNPNFVRLAAAETSGTMARDKEDELKLEAGIRMAVDKGVLKADVDPGPYQTIDVLGKSVEEVVREITRSLPKGGCVLVLVGLSGTGKGTTVARLAELLPDSTTWSNGNVFRSLTLLALKWCEAQGLPAFDAARALTPDNLRDFMSMLTFDKYNGKFDIRIQGLGVDALVSDICNTELKAPAVGKAIPTVANVTQGEVVKFVAEATAKMSAAGLTVLIEGREATVNHIPTPHRFALTLSDTAVIGQRRAAQRLMASAKKVFEAANVQEPKGEDIAAVLKMLVSYM